MKENIYKRFVTIFFIFIICFILIQGLDLQHEDKTDSPIYEYYIENYQETGARNLVESILLDYRAYDTFGEVMVLYISITGIMILGKKIFHKGDKKIKEEKKEGLREIDSC